MGREEDFNRMIKILGRIYDYEFPAPDWYVGLAAQANEAEYFGRMCSFPLAMQHHDELAAERKRQQQLRVSLGSSTETMEATSTTTTTS